MRPRVPRALAALSPRQLGQHVRETGAWMSGRAWAQPLANWEAAPVVTPEQFYRAECERPADLMASYDGGEYEPVPGASAERGLELVGRLSPAGPQPLPSPGRG
jgi:hypothetical protein